jgi:hypothetical protein
MCTYTHELSYLVLTLVNIVMLYTLMNNLMWYTYSMNPFLWYTHESSFIEGASMNHICDILLNQLMWYIHFRILFFVKFIDQSSYVVPWIIIFCIVLYLKSCLRNFFINRPHLGPCFINFFRILIQITELLKFKSCYALLATAGKKFFCWQLLRIEKFGWYM